MLNSLVRVTRRDKKGKLIDKCFHLSEQLYVLMNEKIVNNKIIKKYL